MIPVPPCSTALRQSGRTLLNAILFGAMVRGSAGAQSQSAKLPMQPERTISFETTEGTGMNVDLSADGRTLVFDLLGDIYTLPIDGGTATQLTRGLGYDRHPVWSPDGKWIAYVSDASGENNLWVMTADGTDLRPVAGERESSSYVGVAVEWTADGQALVRDDTIYYLAGGKRPLLGLPSYMAGGATLRLSPDGRYVYFNHALHTRAGAWRYDRTTGKTRRLIQPPMPFSQPVVSPNARWLAYVARSTAGDNGLRIRDLETEEDRWLAYPIDDVRGGNYARYVFTHDSKAVVIGYGGKLHRIDVATGKNDTISFAAKVQVDLGPFVYHRFRVTNDSLIVRYIRSPDVSPDGTTLVFSALQRLYTMALPHGAPRPLVDQKGHGQFQPAYSPDGKWIAYVTWRDGEGGYVWRVPAMGGKPQRLTMVPAYYQRPVWSPDGATLAVLNAGTRDVQPVNASRASLQLVPSTGGTPETVLENVVYEAPVTFTSDGQRLLAQQLADGPDWEAGAMLVSVGRDGHGRRALVRVLPPGFPARKIVPSPDGRYVAYTLRDELYLAPLIQSSEPVTLGDSTGMVPVVRVAHGPFDVQWEQGGQSLTWIVGNQLFSLNPDRAMIPAPDASPTRPTPDQVISIHLAVPRQVAHGVLALRGARVITMNGDEVLENATIVITNDRITAVGPSASVAIPKGADMLDMRGKTIMPGIVDLHAHFAWRVDEHFNQHDWTYLAALAYGVTTARDPVRPPPQFGDAERIETGQLVGPRLFPIGWNIAHGDPIGSLDDARAVVAQRKALGAITVKSRNLSRRQWQWVYRAADEAGLNVTNEGSRLTMLLDGATGMEHAMTNIDLHDDVARLFAEARTWYTPTLQVGWDQYFRERYHRLYDEPKYRRFAPDNELEARRSGEVDRPDDDRHRYMHEIARRAADIVHQGGRVGLGSHGNDQGLGVHWELWALQMGGLTSHEALRAATLHGAEGLGIQEDLGSIEVGKLADLVILDQNPLENIQHSLAIRYVMKNGIVYDGNTLNTLWPEKRALPTWRYANAALPHMSVTPTMSRQGER